MKKLSILYLFIVSLNIIFAQNPVTIHVATVENTITPYLYGSCIEDVNHEIYGGLYDQKIFGESFEEDSQSMSFDEFDDYGGNWSVSSSALSVTADDGSKLLHHSSFSDGSIEVEMKFNDVCESAALILRVNNPGIGADNWDGYEIGLNAITHEIILGKHQHNWQPLGNTAVNFNSDEWTRLRVELSGSRIRIYVNDAIAPNVDYIDNNVPFLSGKIGLRTWLSNVSFRNLKIKTNGDWTDLPFSGVVTRSGQWDILRENPNATFIREQQDPFNGTAAQKIVFADGSGRAGLINGGLNRWGIAVKTGQQFQGRMYLRCANFSGDVTVALLSADGQSIYASQKLKNIGSSWAKYPFQLTSTATDSNARFAFWIENEGLLWIDQVVLEGVGEERFHNLPCRADIGNAMVGQGLTFLRYGGTMVNAPEYRFKKMIGDPDLRPPYRGHWYPFSTNGFGIEDFLKFCEAAGFEPAFAINIEETAQDAADMIEYLNGETSTVWGAKRAENGHPEPYRVKYIEIGNEEVLFNGDVTAEYTHYIERFLDLFNAMKAKDPNLKFINSAWWRPESTNSQRVFNALNGKADFWDYHPWTDELTSGKTIETELRKMQEKFKEWDVNTNMKCAIFEENGNLHNFQRALAHATVLNTVRRMGDFVLTSCAANALQPYLQNDNGWDQGQIFFTPSQVWGMPTYYAQQMAAQNHLPKRVKQTSRGLTLDVTATTDENAQRLVLHIVNTQATNVNQSFNIQNFNPKGMADVIQLTAALSGDNTPEQPEKIIPQFSKITLENASFAYNFPAYSYTIIRIMKNGTSVNSANEERITVSGSKGGVNINCNNPFLNAKVNIFSLLGENLYNKLLTKNNDFLALPSGAYIIKVTDSGFQKTQKIVVL
ncbi:alpha-L-arabinofuranosidase C-terminal domain-containing protein [Porphyromonadaceae sp. NP-X]|nr:alpha-L-arabinofuranosidase C-terminal domain-containing protein [Porphyromonadaceae sp. NP-X]